MSHKYKILYKIESRGPVGVDRDQIPDEMSATDAIFAASIIYPADGSLSIMFMGYDGRKPPVNGHAAVLEDDEWFKVWTMLAERLARSSTLSPEKRHLCALLWETFVGGLEMQRAAEAKAEKIAQDVGLRPSKPNKKGPRK